MKTKSQITSLKSLMGIAVVVMLFIFTISFVSNFFFRPPIEKDIIEKWEDEISELKRLNDNRVTQLFPVNDLTPDNIMYFITSEDHSKKPVTLSIGKVIVDANDCTTSQNCPEEDYIRTSEFTLVPNCANNICLCTLNIDTLRSYCVKTTVDKLKDAQNNNDIIALNYNVKHSIQNTEISSFDKTPYIKVNNNELSVCENKQQC